MPGRCVGRRACGSSRTTAVYAELDLDDTVGHAVNAYPDSLAFTATKKSVNRFLAMLQFSEADLQQKIGTLSGGQRARVAIAQCLLSGAAVIVLDEPTNHLDITSTQVMERALTHFPGAVRRGVARPVLRGQARRSAAGVRRRRRACARRRRPGRSDASGCRGWRRDTIDRFARRRVSRAARQARLTRHPTAYSRLRRQNAGQATRECAPAHPAD